MCNDYYPSQNLRGLSSLLKHALTSQKQQQQQKKNLPLEKYTPDLYFKLGEQLLNTNRFLKQQ